jgi:hypothetical protein
MRQAGHLALGALVVTVVLGALPAGAQTVPLATFRSVHDLVLDKSVPSGDISDVSARLVTEFTGSACKGYTDQTRFVMQTIGRDGSRQTSDLRQMTVETTAGHFSFDQKVFSNSRLVEQSMGMADRAAGGDIAVSLTRPETKAFALPRAVVFPIELTRNTLAAALAGKRFLTQDLYSGDAEGETVYATATVIGPQSVREDFGDDKPIGLTDFATLPHWPVTVSFFITKGGTADANPVYVSSYVLYENGMVGKLRIRYGDFGLVGTLMSYQPLAAAVCP